MVRRLREEDGFTLMELLASMAVLVLVLAAVLGAFEAFSTQTQANTKLTSAQDTVRREVDAMTRMARNATPVGAQLDAITRPATASSVNDVIFGTYGVDNSTTPRFVRYCVNTITRSLWREQSPNTTGADPGGACPSAGAWTRSRILNGTVANTATTPAFTVDAARRAIGIDLRIDGGATSGSRPVVLRSAAYLRSASGRAPNLAASDIIVTCSTNATTGKKTALLSLGAGIGAAQQVTAEYVVNGVLAGSSSAVKIAADSAVTVGVTITNALGLKQLLTRTVTC